MRDSQTGDLLPVRDAEGTLPDLESCWDTGAVSCQNVTLISFSFRAWIGLIWEISLIFRTNLRHFSARVFFVKISKSQYSMIYTICSFIRIHIPKMDSFPMLFSHPTRPPVRPPAWPPGHPSWITGYQTGSCSSISQFKTESKWFMFQYFSVHKLSKWIVFPIFS